VQWPARLDDLDDLEGRAMGMTMNAHHAVPARLAPPRSHPKLHLVARALVAGLLLLISGVALAA
jgi:hypothetical protein